MSNSDPDLDVRDPTESSGVNTDLSTDGAVSLFSTVLSNALEQQKNNIIQHFESRFANEKSEKATGVDATDFTFKSEGNRIQHSFNLERSDKLSKIDSFVKFNSLDAASRLISEEKETLRKRNKILKIADKHGWDTVQEYLDSPLADNKDDAVNLRSAITRANSRRRNSKPYDRPVEKSTNGNGRSDNNGTKFNTKEFFRGFSQFNANDGNRDASEYAGAGFTVGDNHIVHFMWDKEDRIKSSTWRELKAVKNILESLQLMLCGKLVKLYTDNQNVVKIVQKGSMKLDLQVISLDIFHICLNNNIVLEVEWIPRNENTCADALSKIFDFDDWGVSQNIFNFFNSLWGPFTCDTFADDRNKRLSSQWKQFEDYANNPRLASVIDVLPSIIESSKAKSTNNKYRIYFEKFRKWCVSFGLQYSPATSTTISLYIGGLIQQGISVSVLESNYYSIKWHHDKNFKDNPCSDEFLSLILEGGKRILSKPINKKEPVTPEILQMIISKYGIENDLSSLRICVLCLLGFSGFLRYSELAAIKAKHITFLLVICLFF
ncbi:unnamed protein product [Mytilus edulis]|uniref:RNase H type-1 domain-containing protein n=1 Tax=Mytilus edulis TaxID=6550 RepID=A0A8S3RUB0_MYTED|nr:unnamed protein product [Mytilus edulis]